MQNTNKNIANYVVIFGYNHSKLISPTGECANENVLTSNSLVNKLQ